MSNTIQNTLPAHIRQLVDKKNYVIAIKTLAQEQHISMEEAKNRIDAYEASQSGAYLTGNTSSNSQNSLSNLNQGLDNHLAQQHIKVPLIPRWVWRIGIILLIMALVGFLLYRLFIQ